MIERSVILPGSNTLWQFAVAASRSELDAQIRRIRSILIWSFVVLGLGLFIMAACRPITGWPLRRVRRAIAAMREGGASRVNEPLPLEVQPLVLELNALLEHSERQAEEARTHAGNLAHALKTPLTVVMNAATAKAGPGRYGDPRGRGDAAPGRSPPGPRARRRPPGDRPFARGGVGKRRGGGARGHAALSQSPLRHGRQPRGAGRDRAAGPGRDPRQPDRERGQVWRRQRVHHRGREPGGPEVLRHLGRG
jgi:hypothetical protein